MYRLDPADERSIKAVSDRAQAVTESYKSGTASIVTRTSRCRALCRTISKLFQDALAPNRKHGSSRQQTTSHKR
jgi:hypothetical protein